MPGDVRRGDYPAFAVGADGANVPIVTTAGDYRYLGDLDLRFNNSGDVTAVDGRVLRVSANPADADAVSADPDIQANVIEPVREFVADLDARVVATSEVALNGRRSDIRTRETNLGNAIADSLLSAGQRLAADFGVDAPTVAFQNGGGIRNNSVLPAGTISELDTFDVLPFSNFVSVIEDVPLGTFLDVLENAVSRVEFSDGRFAQVSGFQFTYDPERAALDRVIDVFLADGPGTQIVDGGQIVAGLGFDSLDVATIDFLANGGDGYPLKGLPFTRLGETYQLALQTYLASLGTVTADLYPVGGEGRISVVPEPASAGVAVAVLGLASLRRRRA